MTSSTLEYLPARTIVDFTDRLTVKGRLLRVMTLERYTKNLEADLSARLDGAASVDSSKPATNRHFKARHHEGGRDS